MTFSVLDTQSIYRRLLAAPDAESRDAVFSRELVEPFAGLARFMGGGDGVAMFRQWGMNADQFAPEASAQVLRRLDVLSQAGAWERAAKALTDGWKAFAKFHDRFEDAETTFALMLCDMSAVPLQRGYSGFGAIPGWIMTVYDEPSEYNLQRIEACTVHELHHNLLRRVSPVNLATWTVGDYMVMEGLAESFAAELYGEDKVGFWVTDFDQSRLDESKAKLKSALDLTGFGVLRGYLFGDDFAGRGGVEKVGVPAFAGYALGYHVVQAYLKKTGKSVAEATFVPWKEIIETADWL